MMYGLNTIKNYIEYHIHFLKDLEAYEIKVSLYLQTIIRIKFILKTFKVLIDFAKKHRT